MTIKSFYLVGQDKATYGQDIHVEQYHDLEALQAAVASQYNIIDANGVYKTSYTYARSFLTTNRCGVTRS